MAVDASLVSGTRLYYSTDSGSNYNELADMKSIGEPGSPEAPDIDVTPLNPTGSSREFKPGLLKNGELTFRQYYVKTRMTTLRGILRTTYRWKVTLPDSSTLVFDGYLKKCTLSPMDDPDDVQTIDCTVTVTGAITFTAA